ncbi:PREDICTED: uncharacterized protein LOC106117157 [Papilio xuthus]|uniref:Uncharacterized protein LOC106117157 n=1 Tax=Papilio xuthus TaxID=66420 RepID=A0AAJ6Z7G3_PAPXU|nr:PREDICTED: uncharacterized protein LOC106117157 [Papilio xuthus]
MNINQIYHHRAVSTERNDNLPNWLLNSTKKRLIESSKSREIPKKNNINQCTSNRNVSRNSKRRHQTYAVNLCLCEREKNEKALALLSTNQINEPNFVREENIICEIDPDKITSSFVCKNTLPFVIPNLAENPIEIHQRQMNKPFEMNCSCRECKCLNKAPSSTSLNKLLDIFRHEEFKTAEFVNNESLKNLISEYDYGVKLHKDIFTSTIDEVKSMEPESKLIDTINPDIDSFIKYPSISLQINSLEDETSGRNKVICKDINLCNDGDHEKTIQSRSKENINMTKITINQQDCQIPDKSYKCINAESKFCNTQTSVQSFISRQNEHNVNLISKSNQIAESSETSFYSVCPVEFLGVTLTNNESNNVSTSTYSKNQLVKKGTFPHLMSSTYCQYTELDIKQSSNSKHYDSFLQNNDVILSKNLNCICCNKVDESDDLELNTFELLTEYLQKKLEDFKLTSYKTSNMLPYEEDVLYNDIIKKVKKLILDMNDEVLCTCLKDNQNDNIDASWKRASCLLQEYLRNKIKRITCSCTVTIKNSSSVLPGILDKVCQLIEDDFKKLKHAYIERSVFNIDKHNFRENSNQNDKKQSINEILTKDIANDTSQMLISICNMPHKMSTFHSTEKASVLLTDTEELKTNEIESSELLQFEVKTGQNSLLTPENANKENSFFCECSDLRCKNLTSQLTSTFSLQKNLDGKVLLSIAPETKENNNFEEVRHSLSIPYIGYTLDCTCDKMLGPCVCAKSALAKNKNIYDDIWKVKENINTSYIMQGAIGEHSNTIPVKIVDYDDHNLVKKNSCICEKVIDANLNKDEIRLKISTHNLEPGIHNSTNTSRTFDDVDYSSYNDWDDCESYYSQNINEASTNKSKLYDSLNLPIDYLSNREKSKALLNSDDVLLRGVRSVNCDCELVPICHVKMLIDNIERKLENCKCTCDSLCPNVCPVHNETVSF